MTTTSTKAFTIEYAGITDTLITKCIVSVHVVVVKNTSSVAETANSNENPIN